MVACVQFVIRTSLHEDYVDADFVHSILGRILARPVVDGDDEEAGYIRASLVQFGEAMDHGISTNRLGDCIDGSIAEYWNACSTWISVTGKRKYKMNMRFPDVIC